jgi:hypothetical protein
MWEGKGEVTRVVALLHAEGGEEDPQVSLEEAKDGRAREGDAVVLALSSSEALVVNVTGCIFIAGGPFQRP